MTALTPTRFSLAEFKRTIHYVTPEAGTAFKQVLDPTYWVHVARSLAVGSKIELLAEDNSYYAELLVVDKIDGGVIVRPIFHTEMEKTEAREIDYDGHIIKYAGPVHLHQVIRKAKGDKEKVVLKSGLRTKREAMDYIDGQNKARAA